MSLDGAWSECFDLADLLGLDAERHWDDHTLLSALEPCLVAALQLVFFLEALPSRTSARTLAPETLRDAERLRGASVADCERFADALQLYRRF